MGSAENELGCKLSNNAPKWSSTDLFIWKLVPSRFGGGRPYIRKFKDAWVGLNKEIIRVNAVNNVLPIELLAGVCWIEVGGDPNFIDRVAFDIRDFDWSGPAVVDRHLTVTKDPIKTSFGSVSMQLRTAVTTLGMDVSKMSASQVRTLSYCLENDVYNIEIVARHLRQLAEFEKFSTPLNLEQVRIIGARYNRGTGLSLDDLKKNTSYGDFIVNRWEYFNKLVS
ncbi:hypothetical protein [Scandinavium goeteborgense]|uniref:Uncharacterized protein n=1 Tax=Scandinavium goeteborgense TaxID=1851514 RepID=A0A4R6ECS2_SCAGO|nr:hypothetical protein [Scandinavium goeteborgense]TDN55963.1 hypothetical protein EC847_1127 [Scandinavium goeteborgense]